MNCHCGKIFDTTNKLIIHLEYAHKILNNFVCPVVNCKRSFQRKDAFKQHLNKKHINERPVEMTEKMKTETIEANFEQSRDTFEHHSKKSFNLDEYIQSKFNFFERVWKESVERFVSNLYDNMSLSRSCIQNIIDKVAELFASKAIDAVLEIVEVNFNDVGELQPVVEHLKIMLNMIRNLFEVFNLHTEYRRFNFFYKSEKLIKPVQCVIGVCPEECKKNNQTSMVLKNMTATFVPMGDNLRMFLQLPGVFEQIFDYLNNSQNNISSNVINNLMQGALWQSLRPKYEEKIVFPIILYFDEFECGNPLGSHAGVYKLGAVYYTLASIPPEYSSRLENIFLALLFHSSDRALFGNRATFNPLLNELKLLEDKGITLNVNNKTVQVYFTVAFIVGDNLGLHSIFGYTQSFSAKHFCRFCTSSSIITKQESSENEIAIKQKPDYIEHLQNFSFGIKEDCVWHDLEHFHAYDNWTADVMHDLFEGVHRYDMALIIQTLIVKQYFTLDILNSKIKYFSYECSEKNIPPRIKNDHLLNGCIIMSASEMVCLVRNFRFIIGNLIPDGDPIWNFYLKLLQITDYLTSSCVSKDMLDSLQCLVTEHHEMYLSLFKCTLKPKHHFLLHYRRIMIKTGPLVKLSCMRFEAKHKDLKSNSNNVCNRKNLPYTLALRMQLKVLTRLISNVGLSDTANFGKLEHTILEDNIIDNDMPLLPSEVLDESVVTTWYEINGIRFNISDVIMITYINNEPRFGQIKHILVNKEDSSLCSFVYNVLHTVNFNLHYRAYKVLISSQKEVIQIKNIYFNVPTIIHTLDGEMFVSISKMK